MAASAAGTPGVLLAGTRMHAGKSTTCMAIMSGLRKRLGPRVGYIKPIGQHAVPVTGTSGDTVRVDRDAALVRKVFALEYTQVEDMNPINFARGYTKRFLDGEVDEDEQREQLLSAGRRVAGASAFVVAEGSGHIGVGSVCGISNPRAAALLGYPVVLVARGGIGSAIDDVSPAIAMCNAHGTRLAGVILNRVVEPFIAEVRDYAGRGLARVGIRLLGVVPELPGLDRPTARQVLDITEASEMSGHQLPAEWNAAKVMTASLSLDALMHRLDDDEWAADNALIVTHVTRMDVLLALLAHAETHRRNRGKPFGCILLLCAGADPHVDDTATQWRESHLMMAREVARQDALTVLLCGGEVAQTAARVAAHVAKLTTADGRVGQAVAHYEQHIDFDGLLEVTGGAARGARGSLSEPAHPPVE